MHTIPARRITAPCVALFERSSRDTQVETSVEPKRQKLLNVKLGAKLADDTVKLSSVKLPKVVMMMGSTEASISEMTVAAEAAPEVLDDFDVGVNEEVVGKGAIVLRLKTNKTCVCRLT